MNEQIRSLLDQIGAYLEQPLLLNSELEAIKNQLNQVPETDPEAYPEINKFLKAIRRAENQINLVTQSAAKHSEKSFSLKTSENFLFFHYLPIEVQTIIFNTMNSYSEAALLGRTCKALYNCFLTNYQLKEFEAIPLKSTNNILFFHARKQTPAQFIDSLQITHIEPNRKLTSFFNQQPPSIFTAKKIVGVALLLLAIYCLYDFLDNGFKIATNSKLKTQDSNAFIQFLRFLFPLVIGVALLQCGGVTTISAFIRDNNFRFRQIDSSIESALHYRNQQIETILENEIKEIIKSLKQAVTNTRSLKSSYYQAPVDEEFSSEELTTTKFKRI